MQKICKRCGKVFESKRAKYCCNQQPGEIWTFRNRKTKEEDTGTLPALGESNDFAYWVRGGPRNGHWQSAKFARATRRLYVIGESQEGLLGRMRCILNRSQYVAKYAGYKSPDVTAEQMVLEWQVQKGKCASCGGFLVNDSRKIYYDHNHETGEGRGFVHNYCNTIEGLLGKLTNEEFKNYIEWVTRIHNRGSNE